MHNKLPQNSGFKTTTLLSFTVLRVTGGAAGWSAGLPGSLCGRWPGCPQCSCWPLGERPGSAGTTEPLPRHTASLHGVPSRVAQLLHGSSGLPKGKRGSCQALAPQPPLSHSVGWSESQCPPRLSLGGDAQCASTGRPYLETSDPRGYIFLFLHQDLDFSLLHFQLPVSQVVCLSLQTSPSYP